SGQPIIGASVVVKGSSSGALTDVNGNFDLNCPANSQLQISYVGYVSQIVAAKSPVNVTLVEDREQLDEVVVVGYGTMRRTDLTGASTNIKNEAITATIAANPITALQGKSSGVAVFQNSKPGEAPNIRVRGTGTIDSNSTPLYVVDGFPLMDGNLNDINAADIESMEVLKDASSTAIYGSRGANGVVMITTKTGRKDSNNITVDLGLGVQSRARLMNLLTGQEYLDYTGQEAPKNGVWTDWQEECIKNSAITQNYNVSLDGHSGRTSYMLSAGYYDQEGLQLGQGFSKYSVHTNISHKLNKVITVGASMQFTESRQNRGLDNALAEVGRMGFPNQPVKKEDGSWNILTGAAIFNPVMEIESVTRYTDVTRFIGNWFAEFNIAKGFTYKLQIGYDLKNAHGYDFITSQDPHNVVKNAKGSGGQDWARSRTKLMDNIFTYTNKWNEHRFTATGVYSYMDYRSESTSAGITADGDDIIQVWNLGTYTDKNNYTIGSGFANNKLISFTGRINYVYADKYIVTATARYDGSSRFGKDSKWGMFPSVGLAWRASQENFLKNNPVITDLKLRGTWGVTGNQEIGNYMSLSHIESSASNSYTDGTNIV
ncbi:MAG: SusC/RagA family TonB-linked outer membrane protein, partial [Prevotella sp.]|nr:SusC/RagA family TonB-linked outer membrane protein [Prevotella sp.]